MKTPLLIFLSVLPLTAQVMQVQVRVVSIEKSGAATSLLAATPDCDEKLYASLIANIAAGSAKMVQDQTVVVRGGQRARVEAIREWPIVTESAVRPAEWFQYPESFTFLNLGQTLETEVTVGELKPGWPQQPLDVNLAPESASLLAQHPWPVPDFRGAGQMGRTLQPVMATHKISTQALTWTGRTLLLAVTASPGSAFSETAEPVFRYTFLRAGLDGEKPTRAAGTPPEVLKQHRLHAVTIRLPRHAATPLMLSSSGDDAALYASLCSMVTTGAAALRDHSAVLCRGGQRGHAQSHAQFSHPDQLTDFIPEGWSVLNPGCSLEIESGADNVGWRAALTREEALELVPYHPSARHPALYGAQASWVERQFVTGLNIPASGVLCAAAISTTPATEDEAAPDGQTDITFLLQSPPPGSPTAQMPPQTFLQAAIFSLSAGEAAVLKHGDSATALVTRFLAGELGCPAHAATAIAGTESGQVKCRRHVPHPVSFTTSTVDDAILLPGAWEQWACGLELIIQRAFDAEAITVNGTLEWDTAPAAPLGEPGATVSDAFYDRRCMQQIKLESIGLTRGQPVIADVRASNARAGTPEHGRWHVLVLLAR